MDPDRARELLSRERSRIEEELRRLAAPDDSDRRDPALDSGDAAEELFEEERNAGLAEALRERLAAVERAERRLAEGTYGLSVQSGEPIPDARLEVDPAAELTVDEQRRIESGGVGG